MAADTEATMSHSLPALLDTLANSLSSAVSSLPKTSPDTDAQDVATQATILPPTDGISLLNTKSELLLSYLQNLVFLIVLQLRNLQDQSSGGKSHDSSLHTEVVKKLTELRIYLERGVRPLEGRLKYQVDKVLKAADDAERAQLRANAAGKKKDKSSSRKSEAQGSDSDVSGSGSEESDSDEASEGEGVDDLAYRPNLAAFSRPSEAKERKSSSTKASGDGIYRPPKIKPTALPPPPAEREARRPQKSHAIDEFVTAEMSSAPMAQPSIGSTIQQGGRRMISQQQREKDAERRTYEENNFVRLPKMSKKEAAKNKGSRHSGYGGEDWRGLGEGADRIGRLTRKTKGSSDVLDRSRKRRATEDGPRGDGAGIGSSFEKRRKKIESWKR
ncbi:hypothetical protein FQN54_004519 [Arachnomyces sp. PD_36]|nr:hypothetical protein FQN54_004519 [Arachnomyces sp. PD_36]